MQSPDALMVPGQHVRIHGLTVATELNGMTGTIVSTVVEGRFGVAVKGIGTKSIRLCNLERCHAELDTELDKATLEALRQQKKEMNAIVRVQKQRLRACKQRNMPMSYLPCTVGPEPPGFEVVLEAYTVFFRGDGFKGERAYAALYAQLQMHREEWFVFFRAKENHLHSERCSGIVNTLATIYRQRGELELCEKVLDIGGQILECYRCAVVDHDLSGQACRDDLTYKYNVIRYNLGINKNCLKENIPYFRELCAHEIKYKYRTKDQNYLFLIPAILGRKPDATTLKGLTDSEILKLLREACAQSDTEKLTEEDQQKAALRICSACQQAEDALGDFKKCSGCHAVYYCSNDCQKNDWKMHKQSCIGARAKGKS